MAAAGLSSTRTGTRPIDSRRRRLALPSTPRPHRPTDALVSADQEIRGGIAIGDAMGSDGRKEARLLRERPGPARRRVAAYKDWSREFPWRSDLAAARRTAARHSPTSPTHSNGRTSGASPSNVTKRSSSCAFSKGSRPPKMLLRSAASMKGARIRSMKQHLSQVPHHWPRRSAAFWWKARLQLRKTPWNSLSWANCCATHSSLRLRR